MKKTTILVIALIVVLFACWLIYPLFVNKNNTTPNLVPKEKVVPNTNPSNDPENQNRVTYVNATADLIQVELPFPSAVVGKDFSVIGKARGNWFFEASFPIEVLDKNGKSIAMSIAQPQNGEDWMTTNFVNFKSDIKVPQSYIGPATLVLRKDNPSGLAENDASISFPITIEY